MLMLLAITYLLLVGVGIWGINIPVALGRSTSSTSSGGSESVTPAR